MDETISSTKWNFQACLPLNFFILENKYRFSLRHAPRNIYYQDKKTSVYQFKVGYMTHPILKK